MADKSGGSQFESGSEMGENNLEMRVRPEYAFLEEPPPPLLQTEPLLRSEWDLARSRQRFLTTLDGPAAFEFDHRIVVGEMSEDFSSSNSAVVGEWLKYWRIANPNRTKKSSDIYVGITDAQKELPSASFKASKPWAIIRIPTYYIELCDTLAEMLQGFGLLARHVLESVGSRGDQLRVLAAARSGLFARLGRHYPHLASAFPDDDDLWSQARTPIFCTRVTRAAMRWAIAHEYGHMFTTRKDRIQVFASYQDQCSPFLEGIQNQDHRNELACDRLAVRYFEESPYSQQDLRTEILGSLLGMLAIAWEGWFIDQSKQSDTHPSPTLRFGALARTWAQRIDAIQREDHPSFANVDLPGAEADLAVALIFGRWTVGDFSKDRSGNRYLDAHILDRVKAWSDGPPTPDDWYFMDRTTGFIQRPRRP